MAVSGSIRAVVNSDGNVDRFIDASGRTIYIEPKTYTEAVNAANGAAQNARLAAETATRAATELVPIGLCLSNGKICQRIRKVKNG